MLKNSVKSLAIACVVALALTSCAMPFTLLSGNALDARAALTLKTASKDLKDGRKDRAITSLKRMREDLYGCAWGDRAAFLLVVASVKDNQNDEGGTPPRIDAGPYLEEAARLDAIQDYSLFYRAQYISLKGDFAEAASAYADLMRLYPSSILVPQALYKKAIAEALSGDTSSAKADMLRFASVYPGHALAPDALIRIARQTIAEGDIEAALKHLHTLIVRHPAHPAAREAEGLVSVLREHDPSLPELNVAERFERAEALFNSAKFMPAIAEYKNVMDSNAPALSTRGQAPEYHERAVLKTAQALMRLKRYEEAEKTLRGLPSGDPEALYLIAVCLARQGRLENLIEAEKAMASKFPGAKEHGQTLLLTGRMFEERAMPEMARGAYDNVLRDPGFRDDPLYRDALWSLGWLYYRRGTFAEAYNIFSSQAEGKGVLPPARGLPPSADQKFIYWSARSAEKAGMKDAAMGLYNSLKCDNGISYYCRLAQERLSALKAPAPPVESARIVKAAGAASVELRIKGSPRFLAAKELLVLGMNEEASAEVAALSRAASSDKGALLAISGLFYEASDYYRGLKAFRGYQSASGAFEDAGGALASYAFPPGPVELAKGCMDDAPTIDPHLVAAIMREESGFDPGAVSRTGALGIMQIMPATGRLVAKGYIKGAGFKEDGLFDPATNIRLGSRYLAGLTKRFNGNVVLAVAAYNAGPNAVSEWTKTLPSETDEFIESIPYAETRAYTKRVLRSYMEYLRLAGDGDGVDITGNSVSDARNAAARKKNGVGF